MLFTHPHLPPRLHMPKATAAKLRALGVGLVLLAGLCEVAAADEPSVLAAYRDGAVPSAARHDEAAPQTSYEISTVRGRMLAPPATLPNVDTRATQDLAGVNYRVWMSHGRADVGVGLGTLGYLLPSTAGRGDGARALVGAVPTVTVGMRYRMSNEHSVFADASGARGLGAEAAGAYYNTKVGMEWKPAKSRLGLERGAIGLQFDSGYRLSLRARSGGLAVYLRNTF
jgi:hypothetical protein